MLSETIVFTLRFIVSENVLCYVIETFVLNFRSDSCFMKMVLVRGNFPFEISELSSNILICKFDSAELNSICFDGYL